MSPEKLEALTLEAVVWLGCLTLLSAAGLQVVSTESDGCSGRLVPGEHAGAHGRVVGDDDREVPPFRLDPGGHAGCPKSLWCGDAHGIHPVDGSPAASSNPNMRLAH